MDWNNIDLTRREFTTLALSAAAAAGVAPMALAQQKQRPTFFEWKPVANRAWAAFGGGGNALVFSNGEESILVDCKNFALGYTLGWEADARGDRLAGVVNTHHHGDHTGGNSVFTPSMSVIAQKKASDRIVAGAQRNIDRAKEAGDTAVERMTSYVLNNAHSAGGGKQAATHVRRFYEALPDLEAKSFAPTDTIEDELELRLGDLDVQLKHVGPGHTDNDLFVFVPEMNLLHTGDLLFHKLHPFIDMDAGATSAGWIRSCEAMMETCDADTIVVPGHGEITDRSGIAGQKEYFQRLRDAMAEAHQKGMSREEALEIELPIFKGYGFEQIKARTLGSVYDEMQGE
jgi:cyclase